MKRILPYLQLMRLPALFTALTDTFAGLVMTHSSLAPIDEFLWLLLATTGLYLSGMVFNDVFDIQQDTQERPHRPIPAGRVSYTHAIILGATLMILGLGSAAAVGRDSLILAGLLAVCILAYDGILKKTWLGPIAMGGCRFLNISLAASAIGAWHSIWTRPQLGLAIGIGVYILGLTLFARTEAQARSRRGVMVGGIVLANGGVATLVWLMMGWPGAIDQRQVILGLVIIALILNRRWLQAVLRPEPQHVQAGVKVGLLSLIVIDATMIYWKSGEVTYALIALAALIPALFLGKLIPMT